MAKGDYLKAALEKTKATKKPGVKLKKFKLKNGVPSGRTDYNEASGMN